MREVFLGEYIKQKRLDMGLTQARLCEGICEPMTVSRLENGQQTPTRPVSKALLERLGLPGDRYFALLSDREAKIKALEDEITTDSIRCRRAPKDEQPDIRAHALEQLAELGRDRPAILELLDLCDLLIDGPYLEEERDLSLRYRGSANQRLIEHPGKLI